MPHPIDGPEPVSEAEYMEKMKARETLWKETRERRARHDAQAWRETARAVNGFGFRLIRECATKDGNFVASPFSIHLALGMVFAGAQGGTLDAMGRTLGIDPGQRSRLLQALGDLPEILLLESGLHPYKLNIANRAWFQEGLAFLPEYLRLLEEIFRSTHAECDFRQDNLEAIRAEVNQWAKEQTNGMIPEILPQGSPAPLSRLILVNAVHFLARWQFPFEKEVTRDRPFNPPGSPVLQVPTMQKTHDFRYYETSRFQAVELPYEGNMIGMTLFLPAKDRDLPELEDELAAGGLEETVKAFQEREVILWLPRFQIEWGGDLVESLCHLGMEEAFGERADFSGILDQSHLATNERLRIGQVIHRARIDVEEKKTEAAAATAVCMALGACAPPDDPPKPVEFIADRPFLFMIRDRSTGVVLFQGRLCNPCV